MGKARKSSSPARTVLTRRPPDRRPSFSFVVLVLTLRGSYQAQTFATDDAAVILERIDKR
jgi:hypothetical protein